MNLANTTSMRIWRINVESYTLTSFEFSVIEKWKALSSKVRIKCLFFTYPTVKMGCTSDKFCSKYPLSLSRTSMWNVCSNPPPKPTEHVTDRPWVVWLCTSQFWGGSGGPVKIAQISNITFAISNSNPPLTLWSMLQLQAFGKHLSMTPIFWDTSFVTFFVLQMQAKAMSTFVSSESFVRKI